MKHMNISEDAMKIILENAAWDKFGIKVDGKQQIEESTEEGSEEEAIEEAHVCPLCSSHLDEAISDEALMEHTANVLEAVNAATLNEEVDEDEDEVEEIYEEEEEEEEEEETEEDSMVAKHGEKEGRAMAKKMGYKKGK